MALHSFAMRYFHLETSRIFCQVFWHSLERIHCLRSAWFNAAWLITYKSTMTQSKIVKIGSGIITWKLLSEIEEAKYFSILTDESVDVSNVEQVPLINHYVNITSEVCKAFTCYFQLQSLSRLKQSRPSKLTLTYIPRKENIFGRNYHIWKKVVKNLLNHGYWPLQFTNSLLWFWYIKMFMHVFKIIHLNHWELALSNATTS